MVVGQYERNARPRNKDSTQVHQAPEMHPGFVIRRRLHNANRQHMAVVVGLFHSSELRLQVKDCVNKSLQLRATTWSSTRDPLKAAQCPLRSKTVESRSTQVI